MADMMGTDDPRWMINYLQAQRLARIKRAGGSEPVFSPAIDFVMMVGSSQTDNAFGPNIYGRQENPVRRVLSEAGLDVQVINAGVSGNTVLDVRNRLPALLTELARWGTKKGLVIIIIGSNDIGVTDVDAMASATKNTMADNLRYIVAQLRTSGHQVLLGSSSSRKNYNPLYLEWSEKFYQPLIKELTPEWLITDTKEKYDTLKTYVDYGDTTPDFYYADNLHPRGGVATPLIHANLARFLNEFTAPAPALAGDRFLFAARGTNTYPVGGINTIPDNAVGGALETIILSELINLKAQVVTGSKITRTGSMYASTGVTQNPNGVDLDVKHAMLNRGNIYSNGSSWTLIFEPGIAFAGRSGVIKVMSNSNGSGRSLRVAVTGGATVVVQSYNAGALPLVGEVPFTADGTGKVELTMSAASQTYAHLSAIEFDFAP